jgi:hypothetical protein
MRNLYVSGEKGKIDFGDINTVEELRCDNCRLTQLSLGSSLRVLDCSNNEIEELDLSSCRHLEELEVSNNKVKHLDLSPCENLRVLKANECRLSTLNLSNLSKLEVLDIYSNSLSILDLSSLLSLKRLWASDNNLGDIDLSSCSDLETLILNDNRLEEIQLENTPLLKVIQLNSNMLTGIDCTQNKRLRRLYLSKNKLRRLDLSMNRYLEALRVEKNKIQQLDITKALRLTEFLFDGNPDININADINQKYRIETLRNKYKLKVPKDLAKRLSMHDKADDFNWDYNIKPLVRIAKDKLCDLGTALLIYWRGNPNDYCCFKNRKDCKSQVDEERLQIWDLQRLIEDRVQSGAYGEAQIYYDPKDDYGKDWTAEALCPEPSFKLPNVMFSASMKRERDHD